VDLALPLGHGRTCGGNLVRHWAVDLDGFAGGDTLNLSGNYFVGRYSGAAAEEVLTAYLIEEE